LRTIDENLQSLRVKGPAYCIAVNETPSHSYEVSLAIWDHSVICHPTQVNAPHLNPSQISQYSTYLPQRDGRLS